MFTGIVEEVGTIVATLDHGLVVRAHTVLEDLALGESVNVNGVCLTVTECSPEKFKVDLAEETLHRTNLGHAKVKDRVNLERALLATGRMGGHIVQGHIDAVGVVAALGGPPNDTRLTVTVPSELTSYIVEKGFITVDGVSFTVTTVAPEAFSVAVIPYTLEHTVMGLRATGDAVNIEVDILAKYVERLVSGRGD